jgi:hypothetical protein
MEFFSLLHLVYGPLMLHRLGILCRLHLDQGDIDSVLY